LHKFFACANCLLELCELHFYPHPFLLQSSLHLIRNWFGHTSFIFWVKRTFPDHSYNNRLRFSTKE
jgi:hypothetical protein